MMGFTTNQSRGTFRFLNIETMRIVHSRDVVWVQKMFGQMFPNGDIKSVDNTEIQFKTDMEIRELPPFYTRKESNEVRNLQYGRKTIYRGRTRSQTVGEIIDIAHWTKILCETHSRPNYVAPECFTDSWDNNDEKEKKLWRMDIKKELGDIKDRDVWTVVRNNGDIRAIGMKWVFKRKDDGRYRYSLTVLGYCQIAGIDYTDIHAPVLNETALRLLLLMKIISNGTIKKLDVEEAFLEGIIDE